MALGAAIATVISPALARGEDAATRPPGFDARYLVTGIGLFTEALLHPGDVCPSDATAPCILGSGAGLNLRGGFRSSSDWYIGGVYGFSRQDSSNLIRLPILQQLRAEGRYFFGGKSALLPHAAAELGVALYGNEWGAETLGPAAALGVGLSYQIGRQTVVGVGLHYRPLFFRRWVDQAGQERAAGSLDFGVVHFVTLELTVELKSQLSRW
jgi:hypothetical protein